MIDTLLHLAFIALVASFVLVTPAIARVVKWTWTSRLGFTYTMPPLDCRFGPLPPYVVKYEPSDAMDAEFLPANHPDSEHHIWGHTQVMPTGPSVIWITKGLPGPVRMDILIHEQAHLRGCQHSDDFGG